MSYQKILHILASSVIISFSLVSTSWSLYISLCLLGFLSQRPPTTFRDCYLCLHSQPKQPLSSITFLITSIFQFQSHLCRYSMAAFSYQHVLHHPFLFDSIFLPGTPTTTNNNHHLSQSHHPSEPFLVQEMNPVDSARVAESSSCIDQSSTKVATFSDNEPSVTKKQSPESSTVVDKLETGEQVTQKVMTPMEKKRRTRNCSSLNYAQSKVNRKFYKISILFYTNLVLYIWYSSFYKG